MREDGPIERLSAVVVDSQGRIRSLRGAGSHGGLSDPVGAAFADLFDEPDATDVARCIAAGWLGHAELRPTLRGGRSVAMQIDGVDGGWRIRFEDVTPYRLLQEATRERDQLSTVAHLSGSVARELTDPMTILQGRLELMLDLGVSDPETARRHIGLALDHARRVTAALRNLRLIGRTPAYQLIRVDLAAAVAEALELLGGRGSRVQVEIDPDAGMVGGEPSILPRVFASLIRACVEAAGRSPVILAARTRDKQGVVWIGPVARPRGAPRPLDAALTIDEILLRSVGGRLSSWGTGSDLHFEVVLARCPAVRKRPRPVDATLLLVGSEVFRGTIGGVLSNDGFRFVGVSSAEDALGHLVREAPPHGVISELLLPAAPSGLGLSEAIVDRHPDLGGRVLVVGQRSSRGLAEGVVAIRWPVDRASLLEGLGRRVRRR